MTTDFSKDFPLTRALLALVSREYQPSALRAKSGGPLSLYMLIAALEKMMKDRGHATDVNFGVRMKVSDTSVVVTFSEKVFDALRKLSGTRSKRTEKIDRDTFIDLLTEAFKEKVGIKPFDEREWRFFKQRTMELGHFKKSGSVRRVTHESSHLISGK